MASDARSVSVVLLFLCMCVSSIHAQNVYYENIATTESDDYEYTTDSDYQWYTTDEYDVGPPNCTACTYDYTGIRFFADPSNCSSYYMCERLPGGGFRRHNKTCSAGTAWDQAVLTCRFNATCWNSNTTWIPATTEETIDCEFEAVSGDPSSYYQYVHGYRYTMPCPAGLQYNHEECGCGYPTDTPFVVTSSEEDECLIANFTFNDGYTSEGSAGIVADPYGNARIRTDIYPSPALELDGSSYLKVEYFNNWFAQDVREFSVSFWMYPHYSGYWEEQGLINNGDCEQDGSVKIMLYGRHIETSMGSAGFYDSSTSLSTYQWHHVAVVYSADSRRYQLYHNGQLVASASTYNLYEAIGNRQCAINIGVVGYSYTSMRYFFKGLMDDVSFFRCALSGDDIRSQYESRD